MLNHKISEKPRNRRKDATAFVVAKVPASVFSEKLWHEIKIAHAVVRALNVREELRDRKMTALIDSHLIDIREAIKVFKKSTLSISSVETLLNKLESLEVNS